MPFADLREYLDKLDEAGELVHIDKEIDPRFELTGIIRHLRDKPVLFHRVQGSAYPVVGNVFGNYTTIEIALETPRDRLLPEYLERVQRFVDPVVVPSGPVKEQVRLGSAVDFYELPLPTHNAKDGGLYIDAGILIADDPEFGTNLSLQRLQITGRNRAGIYIAPQHHLNRYRQRAEEQDRPLPVAVAIGCEPTLYIASQAFAAVDTDEYTIAGALRQQPVELVRCETVDLRVPAAAEIVLEGHILPHVREEEGPFGEFPGYYGSKGNRPVVEFTAMTYRTNPIFQTIYLRKPPTENVYLTALPKAADLYRLAKEAAPEVKDVYLTPGGCGKYHAVLSIKKRHEGEAKSALLAVLSSRIAVKQAIVVDTDIDIYDPLDVEWAVATRSQFDVDSIVVQGLPHNLDPSVCKRHDGLTAKVGIDATLPLNKPFPDTCDVPPETIEHVRRNWASYGARTGRARTPA
jgi:2,5-furandicarboxylate decarboxylase 1